jgi:hypothetical protein
MADGDAARGDPMIPTGSGSGGHGAAATWSAPTILPLVPVGLVVVAEAAWISVFGGLLQEVAFREPVLGIPAIAGFVAAGIVAARVLAGPLGRRWPVAAFALIAVAGIAGWLASPAARDALDRGIGPAIAAHPAGWMAGLAMLRGFAHSRLPLADDTVERLLELGIPGLAICAIVGGSIAEPSRTRFLADALDASIAFVLAATLALALTRLAAVGGATGVDWRRNPSWLGMALVLLVIAIAAAVPLSVVAASMVEIVFAVALGPLIVLGLLAGLDRAMRRVVAVFAVVVVGTWILIRLFGGHATGPRLQAGVATGEAGPSMAEQIVSISLGGLFVIAAVVAILVLAAVWMRRTPASEADLEETRMIDRGGEVGPRRHRQRFGRRPEPTGAAAAYVALVDDLDRHPDVRRDAAETPIEHAARLRSDGRAELSLDLLAADYALNRYGGMPLPAREDRRAVARWRLLRRRLTRPRAVDRG